MRSLAPALLLCLAATHAEAQSYLEPADGWICKLVTSTAGSAVRAMSVTAPDGTRAPRRILMWDAGGRIAELRRVAMGWSAKGLFDGVSGDGPIAFGSEIYLGAEGGGIERLTHVEGSRSSAAIAETGRISFTNLVFGDFDPIHAGDEVLAFGVDGRVFRLCANGDGGGAFEFSERATLSSSPVTVSLLEKNAEHSARVVVGLATGQVEIVELGMHGSAISILTEETAPISCLASTKDSAGVAVLYLARADGLVVRLCEDGPPGGPMWSRQVVYAGPESPRALVAGHFAKAMAVESIAIAGESGGVRCLTRSAEGRVGVTAVATTMEPVTALAVGELDGRNVTDELVAAVGPDVFVIARAPGFGWSGVATDESIDRGDAPTVTSNVAGEARPSVAPAIAKPSASLFAEGVPLDDARLAMSFEGDLVDSPPTGFTACETAGSGRLANWRVLDADDAADGHHIVRIVDNKNTGVTFNLLLSDSDCPADLRVDVAIRPETGNEDRGGGLVWRAKDANNYYVTRWNPLESNLRVYKVENGVRSLFQSSIVQCDATAWHRLSVVMRGSKGAITFDGAECLEFEDKTFQGSGKVGLWTKADAATSFDGLVVRELPARSP